MSNQWMDQVATGRGRPQLRIAGRPREGKEETYTILEQPGDPVLMHFDKNLVPHFKQNCRHCARGAGNPKPLWYMGASTMSRELVILELTEKCFQAAETFAGRFGGFVGLMVRVVRANSPKSPRFLRCDQRIQKVPEWTYETRRELAGIWGVPIRPKLYREGGGA